MRTPVFPQHWMAQAGLALCGLGVTMSETNFNHGPRSDGAFTGPLDQETFRALLFNSFLHQQERLRARRQDAERLLAAINETGRAVSAAADVRAALNLVAASAVEITGSTGAALAIAAQGQMACWAMNGPTAPPLGAPVPLDSGLAGECLRSGRTLRCDDTGSDPRVNREACAHLGGVGSMLLVPLRRRNTVIGVLVAFSIRPQAFDDSDQHVLELLALIAAAALSDFAESEAPSRVARSLAASVRTAPPQMSPV
jgi:transcriptional regulator with GAF, ATPase, and Fis domain